MKSHFFNPFLLFLSCCSFAVALTPVSKFMFERHGYVVSYDSRFRNPAWVLEHLTLENLEGVASRSKCSFKEDKSIPSHIRASLSDYRGSGFDRGHMAAAANHKGSPEAMRDSFILSNVAPQDLQLNKGAWAELEDHIRDLVRSNQEVSVVSGPLYVANYEEGGKHYIKLEVIGEVVVPNFYFKVVAVKDYRGEVETTAYIMPNEPIAEGYCLNDFKTTVSKVERLSGILF